MIHAPVPNQVKFLIPELVEEINALAEPTLENATGKDVLGDAIADGGVIVNAWDGQPYIRPKIYPGNRALNGGFDSDTLWTKGTDWTIAAGMASRAANGVSDLTQTGRLIPGVIYEVTFTISGYVAGVIVPYAGTSAGTARGSNGTYTEDITCAGNASIIMRGSSGADLSIDNVFYRPKSLWRIDTALQRRPESHVDFAMLVTHNLYEVYQAACGNVLRFFQNTADSLPTDPLAADKMLYGLLGSIGPFISLDGINDKGIVANHADLNFGANTDFALEIIFRTSKDHSADEGALINKGAGITGAATYYRMHIRTDNTLGISIRDGSTGKTATTPGDANDGEWYHGFAAFDRNGNVTVYRDAVAGTPQDISAIGDIDDVSEPLQMGIRDTVEEFDGDIALIRIWNRGPSAAEILTLKNGGIHTPIPAADQDANQTAMSSNNMENSGGGTAYDTFDGVSPTAFHAISDGDPTNRAGGTDDEIPFVSGTKVGVEFTLSGLTGELPVIRCRGSFGGSNWAVGNIAHSAVEGSNFHEFELDTTGTGVIEFFNSAATEYTIADFKTHLIGCVAEYNHDGINSIFSKWFDKVNQHHATLTGVDYWHVPDADNPAFFFQSFTAFNSRYLFTQFNELLEAGQADARLGWVIYGQKYGFNFETGGYQASENWPGVIIGKTDVGIILAEQKFGLRPSWNVTLMAQDTAGLESIHDMLQRIAGPLYPFYIIWDYSHARPVIWQVRLDPEVPINYVTGAYPWRGITFGLKAE